MFSIKRLEIISMLFWLPQPRLQRKFTKFLIIKKISGIVHCYILQIFLIQRFSRESVCLETLKKFKHFSLLHFKFLVNLFLISIYQNFWKQRFRGANRVISWELLTILYVIFVPKTSWQLLTKYYDENVKTSWQVLIKIYGMNAKTRAFRPKQKNLNALIRILHRIELISNSLDGLLFRPLKMGWTLYSGVVVFSFVFFCPQNQVTQIIIRIGQVVNQIKAFSVVIRTCFFFNLTQCRENPNWLFWVLV